MNEMTPMAHPFSCQPSPYGRSHDGEEEPGCGGIEQQVKVNPPSGISAAQLASLVKNPPMGPVTSFSTSPSCVSLPSELVSVCNFS